MEMFDVTIAQNSYGFDDVDEDIKSDYIAGFKEQENKYSKYRIECNDRYDDEHKPVEDKKTGNGNVSIEADEFKDIFSEMPSSRLFLSPHPLTSPKNKFSIKLSPLLGIDDEDILNDNLDHHLPNQKIRNYRVPMKKLSLNTPVICFETKKLQQNIISENIEQKGLVFKKLKRQPKHSKESIASTKDSEELSSKQVPNVENTQIQWYNIDL